LVSSSVSLEPSKSGRPAEFTLSYRDVSIDTERGARGLVPPERQQHGAIYDPVRDRMVVYGGVSSGSSTNDTWAYSPGATVVSVPEPSLVGAAGLALGLPRPNPSREGTRLEFVIVRPGPVTVDVFDASGRRVRRLLATRLAAGSHTVAWDGEDDRGERVGSGLYFVRLRSDGAQATRRVVRTY